MLLVSTDPASNVGQVFEVSIGNQITAIPAVGRLSALEIDPQAAAQEYRNRIVGPVRGVLPEATGTRHMDDARQQPIFWEVSSGLQDAAVAPSPTAAPLKAHFVAGQLTTEI